MSQSSKQYITYAMGNKLFMFPTSLKYETYSNNSYCGITFIIPGGGNGYTCKDGKYDVVSHHFGWERLIISDKCGHKDVPFHKGTFGMLPEGVEVLEL